MLRRNAAVDDKERRKLRAEIDDAVADSKKWMATPNDLLAGQTPADVLAGDNWRLLRDLIRAVQHGMPT